jgi:hypothetical protein
VRGGFALASHFFNGGFAMKKFLVFIALFCAFGVFLNSCDNDNGTEPSNEVTFERYDEDSRPLGTATAYYCTTSAQFDYAYENAGSGDYIYLTNDDTVFTACVTSNFCYASIVGTDVGRSTVWVLNATCTGTWSSVTFPVAAEAENIKTYGGTTQLGFRRGDCEVTNCGTASASPLQVSANNDSSQYVHVDVHDCDELTLSAWNDSCSVTAWANEWYGADEACDGLTPEGYPEYWPNVQINTWIYDGKEYSYAALGTPTVTESETLKRCNTEQDLFVRFFVPGGLTADNEDLIDIVVEYGTSTSYGQTAGACWSSSELEWQADFNVDGYAVSDKVYWRVKAALCDETNYSAGQQFTIPSRAICVTPGWFDCD